MHLPAAPAACAAGSTMRLRACACRRAPAGRTRSLAERGRPVAASGRRDADDDPESTISEHPRVRCEVSGPPGRSVLPASVAGTEAPGVLSARIRVRPGANPRQTACESASDCVGPLAIAPGAPGVHRSCKPAGHGRGSLRCVRESVRTAGRGASPRTDPRDAASAPTATGPATPRVDKVLRV